MTRPEQPRWVALTSPIERLDPLSVADFGRAAFLWENAWVGQSCAGFGVASWLETDQPERAFDALDAVSEPGQFLWLGANGVRPPGPWFGGLAFDPYRPRGDWWRGFPTAHWVLPRTLLWSRDKRMYLTGYQPVKAGVPAAIAQAQEQVEENVYRLRRSERRQVINRWERRSYVNGAGTDRAAWDRLLRNALEAIRGGRLTKVVIARSVGIAGEKSFVPEEVFGALRLVAPSSAVFLIRGSDESVFVGASPELLCRTEGLDLETEALAGSASQGNAAGLLHSDKENREHRSVIDGITAALAPFSETVSVAGSPTLLGVPHLVHLRTAIRARLLAQSRISQVLAALHPTPAVGGSPRDGALSFLAEHENLDRGWYAGAVGWIGESGIELMVALRSAILRGNQARLFVGAGIVDGSTEQEEWEETEAKGLTMLEALVGGGADVPA